MLKISGLVLAGIVLLLGVFAGYVRLAPVQVQHWHIDLQTQRPADMVFVLKPWGNDLIQTLPHAAYFDSLSSGEEAFALLRLLDAAASRTPRTRRIAGSPEEGHMTWESRSHYWGFPDYTTAQVTPAGLTVYARSRFGQSDFGVNAARLRAWLALP